jgi:hypothetical protein
MNKERQYALTRSKHYDSLFDNGTSLFICEEALEMINKAPINCHECVLCVRFKEPKKTGWTKVSIKEGCLEPWSEVKIHIGRHVKTFDLLPSLCERLKDVADPNGFVELWAKVDIE